MKKIRQIFEAAEVFEALEVGENVYICFTDTLTICDLRYESVDDIINWCNSDDNIIFVEE